MQIKRFSIVFGVVAAAALDAAAAPPRPGDVPARADRDGIVLVQSVKERELPDLPAVDTGRTPPRSTYAAPGPRPSTHSAPGPQPPTTYAAPPPPPVPPAPRIDARTAPPPAAADETARPAREVPPPPRTTARTSPPPTDPPTRLHTPEPRVAAPAPRPPGYDAPGPRRSEAPRRPPSARSAFYANCTQQCILSCEASFEACNGDASPANPACVKKLEACRIDRCSCRIQ